MKQRTYIAIDLKSFYASVECRERGLDPMDTNPPCSTRTNGRDVESIVLKAKVHGTKLGCNSQHVHHIEPS